MFLSGSSPTFSTEESGFLTALLEGFDGSYALLDQNLFLLAAGQTFLTLTGLEKGGLPNQSLATHLPDLGGWLSHLIQNFGVGFSHVECIKFSIAEQGQKMKRYLKAKAQVIASGEAEDPIKGILLQVRPADPEEQEVEFLWELAQLIEELLAKVIGAGKGLLHTAINDSLAHLGRFYQLDCSFLFLKDVDGNLDTSTFSCFHEWFAKGYTPSHSKITGISFEGDYSWLGKRLQALQDVHLPSMDSLPDSAQNLKVAFEVKGVESALFVPFSHKKELVGFLGFETVHRAQSWSAEEIGQLHLMGEVLGTVIQSQRTHEALLQANEQIKQILELTSEHIFYIEFDEPNNPSIEWLTEKHPCFDRDHPDDFDLTIVSEYMHPDDVGPAMEDWQKLLAGQETRNQFRVKDYRNQAYVWFRTLSHPVLDEEGQKLRGILGSLRDISKEILAQEQQKKLASDLLDRNNELEQFAYITSHNLRAPVINLSSLLEFIEPTELGSSNNREVIEKVSFSVKRLSETLSDLIQIVTMRDQNRRKLEWLSIQEVYERVHASLSEQILSFGGVIQLDLEIDRIFFSKIYFESILQNLLSNALKYRSVDRPPHIQVCSLEKEGETLIQITDNGIGMDLSTHGHRLFQMYQQIHENYSGSGLGLFIVKSQIESLGGKISVESAPNQGSTFSLYIKHPIVTGMI